MSQISLLKQELLQASDAYYRGHPVMTDYEFDQKCDELVKGGGSMEVGSPVSDVAKKIEHEYVCKSLDKTKDIDEFVSKYMFYDTLSSNVVLMYKLDGATVQAVYNDGKLESLATRGDGIIGEDITHNSVAIKNLPQEIPYKKKLVVRGEALISYSNFDKINKNEEVSFKTPRNLAASSLTMKDAEKVANRHIEIKIFELVYGETIDRDYFIDQLELLNEWGFDIVPYMFSQSISHFRSAIHDMTESAKEYEFATDGLVARFDNIHIGQMHQGTTHHPHPSNGYALKWEDETKVTTLKDIEWSPSKTGLVNPVAIFDPVELDGTTVSRASLHNLSIIKHLNLRIGDKIEVYKANQIIPQIACNLTYEDDKSRKWVYDDYICQSCGGVLTICRSNENVETLRCLNDGCPAKLLYRLKHFVSRDALDIEGLNEKTLSQFLDTKLIWDFTSIFSLPSKYLKILSLDGWGKTSFDKLCKSIEASKITEPWRVISGLSIRGIGKEQSKVLAKVVDGNIIELPQLHIDDLLKINGLGHITAENIRLYFDNHKNRTEFYKLLDILTISKIENDPNCQILDGKSFVITGKLYKFNNRSELVNLIERNGGQVMSSVSRKTSYLINNDTTSNSSKNKKAKELGIPVISEDQFLKMLV